MMKISEINTPQNVIAYWRECISNDAQLLSKDVAAHMVDVMSSDYFDQLYEGEDKDFSDLFELAADLEWQYEDYPDVEMRVWDELMTLLRRLEDKYPISSNE